MKDKELWLSLDSGAHTVFARYIQHYEDKSFRSNTNLNYNIIRTRFFKTMLDKYIGYLHASKNLTFYVTLDVIGHPGYSWDILKYMESNGLYPIPAFHLFEDFKWLSKMIDAYEYIGVAGVNKGPYAAPYEGWIKRVFEQYIQLPDGSPRVKIHGFAATALDILKLYPFYSCDSSTWGFGARLGHIQIPNFVIKNNEVVKYDYFPHRIKSIAVTAGRVISPSHYYGLTPSNRKIIDSYISSLNSSIEKLSAEKNVGYLERDTVNALFYINAEKELKNHYKDNFNYEQGGNIYLAGTASSSSNTVPGIYTVIDRIFEREDNLKFLLSYSYDNYASACLAINDYFIEDKFNKDFLPEMVLAKKKLIIIQKSSENNYQHVLKNRVHLTDLTLKELEQSITSDPIFKKTKVEKITPVKQEIKLVKRQQTRIINESSTVVVESEEELSITVTTEQLPETKLIKVSPIIKLLDLELKVPINLSTDEINLLVTENITELLGSINYKIILPKIKGK
jgi:hypothetical protein